MPLKHALRVATTKLVLLLSCLAAISGANGCHDEPPVPQRAFSAGSPEFTRIRCQRGRWAGLQTIALTPPVDALAWRVRFGSQPANNGTPVGEPCGRANDRPHCELAWKKAGSELRLQPSAGCGVALRCSQYFVLNRGDEVRAIPQKQLIPQLGQIDSAEKATLLAMLDGYGLPCRGDEGGALRSVEDGFEVIAYRVDSILPSGLLELLPRIMQVFVPKRAHSFLLHVARDGVLKEIARKPL
jgi:hypothetical protein